MPRKHGSGEPPARVQVGGLARIADACPSTEMFGTLLPQSLPIRAAAFRPGPPSRGVDSGGRDCAARARKRPVMGEQAPGECPDPPDQLEFRAIGASGSVVKGSAEAAFVLRVAMITSNFRRNGCGSGSAGVLPCVAPENLPETRPNSQRCVRFSEANLRNPKDTHLGREVWARRFAFGQSGKGCHGKGRRSRPDQDQAEPAYPGSLSDPAGERPDWTKAPSGALGPRRRPYARKAELQPGAFVHSLHRHPRWKVRSSGLSMYRAG